MKNFPNLFLLLIFSVFSILGSRLNTKTSLVPKNIEGPVQAFKGLGEKRKQSQSKVKCFQRNLIIEQNEPEPDYQIDYDDTSDARFTERRTGSQVRIIPKMSLGNGNYLVRIQVFFIDYWKGTGLSILVIPRMNLGNLSFVNYASVNYDPNFEKELLGAIVERKLPPEEIKKYNGFFIEHLIWNGEDQGNFQFQIPGNSKIVNWDLILSLLRQTKIGKKHLEI